MLEIRLLGGLDVQRDGEPIEIASRPARVLFAYLALTAGSQHPREKVAGLLWPESDETNARSNLRQALWRLRKAVGDAFLSVDSHTVAFNDAADYWLDTALLTEKSALDPIQAVTAYRGELLPGFYEDWVLLERERLRTAFESKLQQLLDHLTKQEQWPDLIHWAEHWIASGQVPEPAYRALMFAHAAKGDLAAVTSTYQRCVSALDSEIGVEPSAETKDLFERLSQGEVTTSRRPRLLDDERGPGKPRHNLPHQSNPFIGREQELAKVKKQLAQNRLLTLVGPGGTGKTRLAIQAATDMIGAFQHGVIFVSLAPIGSPDLLVQAIAEAIGFPLSSHEDPKSQLLRHLRYRQYLLVMDNFEHLLPAATLVSEILRDAGDVSFLATSRERLNLNEESLLRIDGLSFPLTAALENALDYDAVKLFVDSARRQRPDFGRETADLVQVTRICRLVEGMPLAILLAAAWTDMLTPKEIADEIEVSFDFLQTEWRDMPSRHRSVRAAFEPSWQRLTQVQRALFARLAIFRGGFTRDAAKKVADASLHGLASLANKSLLRRDLETGRYEIHELLRQYAQEYLETMPADHEQVAQAHAAYYADFMQGQWSRLTGAGQQAALQAIEADLENVRRAWRYWIDRRDASRIEMFADSFWRFYDIRGWFNAGTELFREAAEALRPALDTGDEQIQAVYAQALSHGAAFMAQLGYTERGMALAEESVAILQRLERPVELALAVTNLQWNQSYLEDPFTSWQIDLGSESLANEPNAEWVRAYLTCWEGRAAAWQQENRLAMSKLEESLRSFEKFGDYFATVWPGLELGHLAIWLDDIEKARHHYSAVLRAAQENEFDWATVKATRYLGNIATLVGDYPTAMLFLLQSLRISEALGLMRDIVSALFDIASVETAAGDAETAVRLLTLIRDHPLSNQMRTISVWLGSSSVHIRDLANDLLAKLEAKLPPETYAAAVTRGRAMDLESAVLQRLSAGPLQGLAQTSTT